MSEHHMSAPGDSAASDGPEGSRTMMRGPVHPVTGPVRWLPDHDRRGLTGMIDRALDLLDDFGDRIRDAFTR